MRGLRPYFNDLHLCLRAVSCELFGQILLEIAEMVDLGQQPDLDAELARVDLVALYHSRSFAYGDPHEGDLLIANAAGEAQGGAVPKAVRGILAFLL